MTERDLDIMRDLGALVRAAKKEKEKFIASQPTPSNSRYQVDYGWMYDSIWEPYWKMARQLLTRVDYYNPNGSCEDDILAHYHAYRRAFEIEEDDEEEPPEDPDRWWKDVLREIEYERKYCLGSGWLL